MSIFKFPAVNKVRLFAINPDHQCVWILNICIKSYKPKKKTFKHARKTLKVIVKVLGTSFGLRNSSLLSLESIKLECSIKQKRHFAGNIIIAPNPF